MNKCPDIIWENEGKYAYGIGFIFAWKVCIQSFRQCSFEHKHVCDLRVARKIDPRRGMNGAK